MMKRKQRVTAVMALICVTAVITSSLPLFASNIVTIIGEVNETNQIVVDGEIYEVDDTPEGENLVTNYIGKTVKVTGKLNIDGDMRIIAVKSFKLVEK